MALVLLDRVQQTGTANTTVSFTVTGSVAGYQSWSAVGNGNTTYYGASDASGNWEVGLATYSTTGPTVTRTTIFASSNGGAAVTFSGTVNVWVDYPAGRAVYQDNALTANAPQFNATNGLLLNSNTVSASFAIPSGSNAMSTGPVTVASGQSVTVPTGSRWVVL